MNNFIFVVWKDGYLNNVVFNSENNNVKLHGGNRVFKSIEAMEIYYKGNIKTISFEGKSLELNKYKITFNDLFGEFQITNREIGVCESFKNIREAIDYCLKG